MCSCWLSLHSVFTLETLVVIITKLGFLIRCTPNHNVLRADSWDHYRHSASIFCYKLCFCATMSYQLLRQASAVFTHIVSRLYNIYIYLLCCVGSCVGLFFKVVTKCKNVSWRHSVSCFAMCVEVVDYRRLCNTHVVIILLSCSLYFELPLDVRYFYSTVMFCYLLAVIDASICWFICIHCASKCRNPAVHLFCYKSLSCCDFLCGS